MAPVIMNKKIRVFEKSAFLVEKLVKWTLIRYIETLLVFGKDFLESERLIHNAEENFGVKAQ